MPRQRGQVKSGIIFYQNLPKLNLLFGVKKMSDSEKFMKMAFDLAEKGRGLVEPNPLVGAVIVKDGQIVGKGRHEFFGGPHAEVNAINNAGDLCKGAEIYVTLEPCSHFGKTPPCVEAIKRAGISKAFFAVEDPNPLTKGKGTAILNEAGIKVEEGVLEEEAHVQNAPFFKLIAKKMPYVIAKWAMTLDGKIATQTGDSKWISNEKSRNYVHDLRGKMDAIMVGSGTVIADDPLLTCRSKACRTPKRIIIDSGAGLPLNSKLIRTINEAEVIVATTNKARADNVKGLEDAGCKILRVKETNGLVDLSETLKELGRMSLTNVMVEGGGMILGSLFDNGLVDKAMIFVSPKIIGDAKAKSPVSGRGAISVSDAFQFENVKSYQCDDDTVIEAVIRNY